MAKMLLVCGLALLQNVELLSFGPHTDVQQTGFATRGPAAAAPYVGTAALPKLSPEYRDERILSVPNVFSNERLAHAADPMWRNMPA